MMATFCNDCGERSDLIVCDDCEIAKIERLLGSKIWREVRGPRIVADLKAELRMLKAKR